MIEFRDVWFRYPAPGTSQLSDKPTIADANLRIEEGTFALVIGPTGSGKSTLLGLISGATPRVTGGELRGHVLVDGTDTRGTTPRDMVGQVGYCPHDAAYAHVTDEVETELAWSLEQMGVEPTTIARRVYDTALLLGLDRLLDRRIATLSSGERQRLAIGAVLAAGPRTLVLDEPTSALDPLAAEELLAVLDRMVSDLGMTVVTSEHRLDRVLQFTDTVIALQPDATLRQGPPESLRELTNIRTPMVALAERLGWAEVPRSVRDARRLAAPIRRATINRLAERPAAEAPRAAASTTGPLVDVRDVWVQRGHTWAVRALSMTASRGERIGIVGHNGAGKSTLLSAIAGAETPGHGHVSVDGKDPHTLRGRQLISRIGWLPPEVSHLFATVRVASELTQNDTDGGLSKGTTASTLEAIGVALAPEANPRELSFGERMGLAMAILLAHRPAVLLLDEPTVGLDYATKGRLASWLDHAALEGTCVLMASHDFDVLAEVCDRTIVIANGSLIQDGPAGEVLCATPLYSPHVARVFQPAPVYRIGDIPATTERASVP